MLISNFNLYKNEWLDLVFDKRNKEYGAYNIRQNYAGNLTRALLISVVTIVGAAVAIGAAIKVDPPATTTTVVDLTPIKPPPSSKPKDPVKPKTAATPPAKASLPAKAIKFVIPVPTSEPITEEMPDIDELARTNVGPATVDGPSVEDPKIPEPDPGSGGGSGRDITESAPVTTADLSVLPTPFGGNDGWSKFLHKNLRYPQQAVDAEKSGKVWISFIIEKDGSLTDIKMLRGPGFGMDEEALRVLKMAPAWKPGIQYGHAVRVQYTIPINFALE